MIPLAFAGAALLSHALLGNAPPAIAADLAQPLPVVTHWHDFGRMFWVLAFACILVAAVPYGGTLLGLVRGRIAPRLQTLAAVSALSLGAALFLPVIFSSDVYAYAAYGLLDAHGINPYAHSAIALHDPLVRAAIWQWGNPLPLCVYGPLFIWIAKVVVLGATTLGAAGQLMGLRILSSLALLGCGLLMYAAFYDYHPRYRLAAAAGVLLNPVAIWSAAEGHNDSLMLLVVLLGFIAVRTFGYFAGAFIIACSALIKASGAAAAFALVLFVWPDRTRVLKVAGGLACGILLAGLIAWPFESGVRTVLIPNGHYTPQFSVQSIVVQLLGALFGKSAFTLEFGVALAIVGCGAIALHGVRLALRKEAGGAAYIALGLWLLIPNPYPWYALWILPVAFLSIRHPASWAILAASLTIFARYLPETSSAANSDTNLVVATCELALPLAILASTWLRFGNRRILESESAL